MISTLALRGRRALADGDPREAAAVLRSALAYWRGQPLADAAGYDFAEAAAAQLTELRSTVLTDRIEAELALGEGASLIGELRTLVSADPLAERPRANSWAAWSWRPRMVMMSIPAWGFFSSRVVMSCRLISTQTHSVMATASVW